MIKIIGGIAFLLLLLLALDGFCEALGFAIPSPILAMAVLLLFLVVHGKVPDFIDAAASLLFRIFPLLFIPALVSTIALADEVRGHWLMLLLVVTISSFLGLLGAALVFKGMRKSS